MMSPNASPDVALHKAEMLGLYRIWGKRCDNKLYQLARIGVLRDTAFPVEEHYTVQ